MFRCRTLLGVGDVREREPQGSRRNANQNFAHFYRLRLHTSYEIHRKRFGSGYVACDVPKGT
jgi:hypothetical protein